MTVVKKRPLKNGLIPYSQIKDGEVRACVMKLAENCADLQKKVDTLSNAVQELQQKVR